MSTGKRITKAGGDGNSTQAAQNSTPVPAPETKSGPAPATKGKAKPLRIFAVFSWVLALAAEAGAIIVLLANAKPVENIFWIWMIALIAADLVFVTVGSLLWKKANRFDPASKYDKIRFFLQNQLGVIIAVVAFLPLIILVFTNKNLSGKQKKIIGGIGIAALVIAGLFGIEFDPSSLENYFDPSAMESQQTDGGIVYWTNSGTKYHIYPDCQHINTARTNEIFEGTAAQAREQKKITELCKTCENRSGKAKGAETGGPAAKSAGGNKPETGVEKIINAIGNLLNEE